MTKAAKPNFTPDEIDRIIEMAWEDRTPFEAIEAQFGINEAGVKEIMKSTLKLNSYKLWRKRVHEVSIKHLKKRNSEVDRFKCSRQRQITLNKITKR